MIREIKENLYCVTSYTGNKRFVECTNEQELAEYVAINECKGYSVTSVTQICNNGSTPRIAIKSNLIYKNKIKELTSKQI